MAICWRHISLLSSWHYSELKFVNIRHVGHVCASVWLFISRITQKEVMDKFSSKLSGTNCGENLTCCAL